MSQKILLLFFLLLTTSINFAQERHKSEFGKPTPEDFALQFYSKEPRSPGVILFESANNYVDLVDDYAVLIKEVYVKIKVFDAQKFGYATIEIPYFKNEKNGVIVKNIQAITHNGVLQTRIGANDIYDTDETDKVAMKKFTFPNVKAGSILEYTYRMESPYFEVDDWYFQGPVPKMYSEFHSEIPGNYVYNRVLTGNHKLYINKSKVKSRCFKVPNIATPADCDESTYAMIDIPSFKAENYSLGQKNFLSRISYEMVQHTSWDGMTQKITKTWDDVDKTLKNDKDLGRQLKYSNYFEDQLPQNILTLENDLERAKAVFYFIQNQMAWNGKYRILSDIRIKDAFEKGSGNNSEINSSLLNALRAANIESKLVLLSTRTNGLPTLQYPVIFDFNFAIVLATINGEEYMLDATDENTAFGILPFRDLNVRGRVMDFENESYWKDIIPNPKNLHYAQVAISADQNGEFSGKVKEVYTNHIALEFREKISENSEEAFLKDKGTKLKGIDFSEFNIENKTDNDKPLKESYSVNLTGDLVGNNIYLYPFFMEKYFSESPFKAEERKQPIDLGFPVNNSYLISIDLKDKYGVEKLPGNKLIKLPEGKGEISIAYNKEGSKINARLNMFLNTHTFPSEDYELVKRFFETFIEIQSQPIVLKKIN